MQDKRKHLHWSQTDKDKSTQRILFNKNHSDHRQYRPQNEGWWNFGDLKKPFLYIKLSRKPLCLLTSDHFSNSYFFIAQSLMITLSMFSFAEPKASGNAPRKQNESCKSKTCSACKLQVTRPELRASLNFNEGDFFIRRYMFHFVSEFMTNDWSLSRVMTCHWSKF